MSPRSQASEHEPGRARHARLWRHGMDEGQDEKPRKNEAPSQHIRRTDFGSGITSGWTSAQGRLFDRRCRVRSHG